MPEIDAHCQFRKAEGAASPDSSDPSDPGGSAPETPSGDFLPADLPAAVPVIAIGSAPDTRDTDFLLSLSDPRICGVVGWADLTARGCVGHLADRAVSPRFRGVRVMLDAIEDTGWLTAAPAPEVLAALVRLSLVMDVQLDLHHLPVLAEFAQANPDLPIVIDHAARPRLARGGEDPEWFDAISRLALHGNVHCKLSDLMSLMTPEQRADPMPLLRPVMGRLLDVFGPARLIWGSGWPSLPLAADYHAWRALTGELLAGLAPDEAEAIMGGNAARFYGVAVG
ncbi:amidohydrolase family protein [uncultured Paracoccus sp.]|uniref:amidohydrolase family protein n=1 Tax=uncultured Paracoccus sp. TaxID=189685 RepID=UPI0025D22496|nr:amidohydrolase family protein [uncultured Paracoccus sp.]